MIQYQADSGQQETYHANAGRAGLVRNVLHHREIRESNPLPGNELYTRYRLADDVNGGAGS